ncbi:hypothetical protein PFLCHA0_c25380 [Pseudomonas protegens CHA0]|uniref:Uncharacterized protein n=1 Tax=Pseudomonas protegens (strain DSM 19095 / LMG 27888 / CFBP 6595 / CHA0) TaxID=1124983 RepID=A0A2C9EL38_PSEPH|nr:hypothetical protein PFLCHA0_c25380 [Pseudomonas protegens CHA0]
MRGARQGPWALYPPYIGWRILAVLIRPEPAAPCIRPASARFLSRIITTNSTARSPGDVPPEPVSRIRQISSRAPALWPRW